MPILLPPSLHHVKNANRLAKVLVSVLAELLVIGIIVSAQEWVLAKVF